MLRQTNANQAHLKSTKDEFFQALYDNLVERFPNTEILTAVQVLDRLEPENISRRVYNCTKSAASRNLNSVFTLQNF